VRRVVVTGAAGFIGSNLCVALSRRDDVALFAFDVEAGERELAAALAGCDLVYHLAGVNRPPDPAAFEAVNADFTRHVCSLLEANPRRPHVLLSSSTQAALDNGYGRSKLAAEVALADWAQAGHGSVAIYRLPGVFGKWCKPEYNSVVATFCHNTARDLPIRIDDAASSVALVYVGDVVGHFVSLLDRPPSGCERRQVDPEFQTTVGELADLIAGFRAAQQAADLPDLGSPFVRRLHATYLSYLDPAELGFNLNLKRDGRGELAELLRQPHAGQVFFSRTRPGITRGNHYHDSKTERFIVLDGEGIVRLRRLGSHDVLEYAVSGESPRPVIIPPGYAHSIENVGAGDMLTLFWASEVFDPGQADTYHLPVVPDEEAP
jgi:UDP-2-acetamido-2,6-beta-L-arabino-hexul-4-ose reductase